MVCQRHRETASVIDGDLAGYDALSDEDRETADRIGAAVREETYRVLRNALGMEQYAMRALLARTARGDDLHIQVRLGVLAEVRDWLNEQHAKGV